MGLRTAAGVELTGRKTPCPTCPWRMSQAGKHPRDTLPDSSKDRSQISWGCHRSPMVRGDSTQICAGYLQSKDLANITIMVNQLRGVLPLAEEVVCDEPLFPTLDAILEGLDDAERREG